MGFFTSILSLGINKGKISEKDYTLKIENYRGLDGAEVPMRVYYSRKRTNKTAIIFLGASPDG